MEVTDIKIGAKQVKKVLEVVDVGLEGGLGIPEPGKMCVEAAVCYAFGWDHGDTPKCVNRLLRTVKIDLNDRGKWIEWFGDEPAARAKGLRKLAVAQLGTHKKFKEKEFIERLLVDILKLRVKEENKIRAKGNKLPIPPKRFEECIEYIRTCESEDTRIFSDSNVDFAELLLRDWIEDSYDCLVTNILSIARGNQNLNYAENSKHCKMVAGVVLDICIDMKTKGSNYLHLCT